MRKIIPNGSEMFFRGQLVKVVSYEGRNANNDYYIVEMAGARFTVNHTELSSTK